MKTPIILLCAALASCAHSEAATRPVDPCGSKFFVAAYAACRATLGWQEQQRQATIRRCIDTHQTEQALCSELLNQRTR